MARLAHAAGIENHPPGGRRGEGMMGVTQGQQVDIVSFEVSIEEVPMRLQVDVLMEGVVGASVEDEEAPPPKLESDGQWKRC